jgi:hypothetical protein
MSVILRPAFYIRDTPAGRMAFESSTICVVLSDASIEGCAGRGACGIARLKLDLVAISLAMI